MLKTVLKMENRDDSGKVLTVRNPFKGEDSTTCACLGAKGMAGWNLHIMLEGVRINPDTVCIRQYDKGLYMYELTHGITATALVSLDKRERASNYKIDVVIDKLAVGTRDKAFEGYCVDGGEVVRDRFIEVVQNTLDAHNRFDLNTVFVTVDDVLFCMPVAAALDTALFYTHNERAGEGGGVADLRFAADFSVISQRLTDYLLDDYKDETVEYLYCVYEKGAAYRIRANALLADATEEELVRYLNGLDTLGRVEVVAYRTRRNLCGERLFECAREVRL